jgi:hypothetical protein
MPISLTTPWNPGNYDAGKTYVRAKILHVNISPESKMIRVVVDFGDVVDGKWVSGKAPDKEKPILIKGADYEAMVADIPQEGEKTYDAIKRVVYAYLTTKVPELAGIVE